MFEIIEKIGAYMLHVEVIWASLGPWSLIRKFNTRSEQAGAASESSSSRGGFERSRMFRSQEHGAWSKEQGARSTEQGARSKEYGVRNEQVGIMTEEFLIKYLENFL